MVRLGLPQAFHRATKGGFMATVKAFFSLESPPIVSASPPICRIVMSLILFLSKSAKRKVGNRAEPGDSDFFPSQAANLCNLRPNH